MAKWKEPNVWERNSYEFSNEQVVYMNSEVLQKLMQMTPGYEERHKRAIYSYVIAQLADYAVHCYWEVKHRSEVAH